MKYPIAFAACFAPLVACAFLGAALGWKHGGGAIPMMHLFCALTGTWKAIVGRKKKRKRTKIRKGANHDALLFGDAP